MLLDDIYSEVLEVAPGHTVGDVRVGLGYTAVALEDGRCGLAFTLHEQDYESCSVIAEAGTLAGREASDLLSWMKLPDQTACAIGVATANALIGFPKGATESDILDALRLASEDTVGMIGYFGPLVDPVRRRTRLLHIFEREPIPELGVLAGSAAGGLLPECQVVILSATTLLNGTIDSLLEHCKSAREIAVLGPTTPFLQRPFSRRGVTLLSGIHVVDSPRVLRIVSEAGGTRIFGTAVRKLTVKIGK